MPFYTQGPEQFSNTQNGGIEDLQSTFGQSVGAALAEGAASTPIAELGDMARHFGEGWQGQQLSPEDANKQFGIPGALKFDAPVSSAVAADLNLSKQHQILRQDAIDSGPQNIAASVVRAGAGMLPQFLDPINLGASFVPGLGDARMAAALADGAQMAERYGAGRLADGLLGQAARTEATGATLAATRGGRFLQGASQGIMGQAALEPLNYAFDRDEHNDWSMGQALGNIAFGGALGGGLHMLIPHARLEAEPAVTPESLSQPPSEEQLATPMTARMEAASPDTRGQVMGDAIAAVNEDRPNNSESLLQLNEAQNLRDEVSGWIQQNERVQNEQDTLLNKAAREDARAQAQAETSAARQETVRQQLAALREQHAVAAQETQNLRDALSRNYGDTTPDRVEAIHEELERPGLTTARRQQLEHELQMVTEGGGSAADRILEQARTQAQIRGMDRRTSALTRQIARLEKRQAAAEHITPDVTATRAFKEAASRIQSRQEVLHALTHRSLARYARRVQSGIADAGLHGLAARILSSENPDEEITSALGQINGQRGQRGVYTDTVNQAYRDALQRMAGAQTDAANDLARSMQREDSPEIASARQASGLQTENAPDAAGPVSEEMAQAEAALSEVDAQIERLTDDARKKELSDISNERQRAEGTAKAYEAATGCMLRNMQ